VQGHKERFYTLLSQTSKLGHPKQIEEGINLKCKWISTPGEKKGALVLLACLDWHVQTAWRTVEIQYSNWSNGAHFRHPLHLTNSSLQGSCFPDLGAMVYPLRFHIIQCMTTADIHLHENTNIFSCWHSSWTQNTHKVLHNHGHSQEDVAGPQELSRQGYQGIGYGSLEQGAEGRERR
jgi:hypothetical protein